jgi:hypothetical protein
MLLQLVTTECHFELDKVLRILSRKADPEPAIALMTRVGIREEKG